MGVCESTFIKNQSQSIATIFNKNQPPTKKSIFGTPRHKKEIIFKNNYEEMYLVYKKRIFCS